MKRFLLFLLLTSVSFGVFDRDIYPIAERKFFRTALSSLSGTGTADGQLLYWNDTSKSWVASVVTDLKWTPGTAILLVDTLNLTNGLDISDYTNLAVSDPIILANDTVGFDGTLVDAITWSDGANVSNAWIFDVSGTDTTLTFGSALISLTGGFIVGDGGTTDYSQFAADGLQTMFGDARVIKHLHFTMELGKGGSAPVIRFVEDPYVSYTYRIFTTDDSHLTREAPDDMDYTVESKIKVHWYTSDASAGGDGDEVRWGIRWASRAVGERIDLGETSTNSGDIDCAAQYIIVESTAATIPANSIADGDIIGIHLQRVALGAGLNPAVGTVHVLDVELEYTKNRLGTPL